MRDEVGRSAADLGHGVRRWQVHHPGLQVRAGIFTKRDGLPDHCTEAAIGGER